MLQTDVENQEHLNPGTLDDPYHWSRCSVRVADKYIEYVFCLFDWWSEIGLFQKEHRIFGCVIIIFYVFVIDSTFRTRYLELAQCLMVYASVLQFLAFVLESYISIKLVWKQIIHRSVCNLSSFQFVHVHRQPFMNLATFAFLLREAIVSTCFRRFETELIQTGLVIFPFLRLLSI